MKIGNLETSSYRDGEVLFFVRIKGKDHFFEKIYGRNALAVLFPQLASFPAIAEYPGIAEHTIDFDRRTIADLTLEHYAVYNRAVHQDMPSIIARCRGLRAIPYEEAKELVLLHTAFFVDFFRAHPFRLFVFHVIDNYVLDVLVRVGRDTGVQALCLSEFFIQGYRRHTIYGEYQYAREPSADEIARAQLYFQRRQKSFWLTGVTPWKCLRLALYIQTAWLARYLIRYLVGYKLRGIRSYEYRFAHLFGSFAPRDFLVGRYFDDVEPSWIDANRDKLVYLPLHVFPEANVDYWMADFRHADYYAGLYEALSYFRSQGMTVIVKEHPGFLYLRDWRVYHTLKQFENVRLVHPFSPASATLDSIRLVMVWMGSAGVEALMDGRRVVKFLPNYYSDIFVPDYKSHAEAQPLSEDQKDELLRRILAGVYPL
jgi:hypothetical protein